MKFDTYTDYVNTAQAHFSSKTNLKVPPEYMILSEEMFNLFNGTISFGTGDTSSKGCCQDGQCKCEEEAKGSDCGGKPGGCDNCDCNSCGGD